MPIIKKFSNSNKKERDIEEISTSYKAGNGSLESSNVEKDEHNGSIQKVIILKIIVLYYSSTERYFK